MRLTRRRLIGSLGAAGAAGLLGGCDRIGANREVQSALFSAENMHRWLQRSLVDREALAPEYRADQRSRIFRANGTFNPRTDAYKALWRTGFADWRLMVDGMVARPLALSLADLRALPQRTQITRHDCVEGWSAIGKWQGVPLIQILRAAGLRDGARFLVFHCADRMGDGKPYYESIDRVDAFHPQTILAHSLNDRPLTVANGAPARLRVERHLGYKHAKYLMRIEAVADLSAVHGGKGGYWEDAAGYEWYAGI